MSLAQTNIPHRKRLGKTWRLIFMASTIVGIIVLTLCWSASQSYGYVG
jgi:hypothetical protein